MMTLQVVWFIILVFLVTGYAVMAGFDLGIGAWHLFARKAERPRLLTAVGPFWDGNQVWLVTLGGVLFAAFPPVYASMFSGMYLALMLVLCALIVRTVSLEFGARTTSEQQRTGWGIAFAMSSIVAMLLFGVALGNVLRGLPLDAMGDYYGELPGLLSPYALGIGLLNLLMLSLHGALYMAMKFPAEVAARPRQWARIAAALYLPLLLAMLGMSYAAVPHLRGNFQQNPVLLLFPLCAVLSVIVALVLNAREGHARSAFLCSALGIVFLLVSAGVAMFPMLIPATSHPAWSLTAFNASSSLLTLKTMLVIVAIGFPLVIAFTIWSHRIFRGPVEESSHYY